jgi:hypothetical protein
MEKASYPSGRVYDPNTWWWTPNLTDEIYQCADEVPPIRMVESVKLKATLSMVYPMSFDDLEFGFTHTGKKYKYLDYDRIVTIVGTAVEVVPYYNKKKIGETSQVLVAVEGQGGTQESAVPVPTAEKANGPHGWGSKNGLGFGDEDEDDALYGG